MITLRPFVCPGSRLDTAHEPWQPSPGNDWWRPRTPFYPSTHQLLPGDVLLFAPLKSGSTVQWGQTVRGAGTEHARFTHAALYVGLDHLICEATPKAGVMYSVLDLRLENHCWIARRWPGLSLAQRHRIVALAANRLGEPYNLSSLVFEFVNPGSGKRREIAGRGLVCSRLCDRSIALALLESGFPADQIAFSTGPRNWVTPAILSQTTKLQDVSINWRNSASSSDVS